MSRRDNRRFKKRKDSNELSFKIKIVGKMLVDLGLIKSYTNPSNMSKKQQAGYWSELCKIADEYNLRDGDLDKVPPHMQEKLLAKMNRIEQGTDKLLNAHNQVKVAEEAANEVEAKKAKANKIGPATEEVSTPKALN